MDWETLFDQKFLNKRGELIEYFDPELGEDINQVENIKDFIREYFIPRSRYINLKYRPILKKRCSKCKEDLSVKNFYQSIGEIDGLQNICKECSKKYTKSWQQNNRDRVNKI